MNMERFTENQRVSHTTFGKGTVIGVRKDAYEVMFDSGKRAVIKEGYMSAAPDIEPQAGNGPRWPDCTFVREGEEVSHFLGSHWAPFVDDRQEIFSQLPDIMPKMLLQTGYGDFYKAPRKVPENWVQGFQLVWPLRVLGLACVAIIEKEYNSVASIFPFYQSGIQQTLTLDEVSVWESGVEAHITAQWGEAEITFFDSAFVVNRAWYTAGKSYDFILIGIAYGARIAERMEFEVELPPAVLALEQQWREADDPPLTAKQTLNLDGAAIFLPLREGDDDDYQFHGPVRSVEPMKEWLGQTGWRVRVTVMRFDDEDADLDIIITRKAWGSDQPPSVGDNVEGNLWLQGYLWMPM